MLKTTKTHQHKKLFYIKKSKDSSAKYYRKNINYKTDTQKRKKKQNGHERYENLSKDEKQRLVNYRKKIIMK